MLASFSPAETKGKWVVVGLLSGGLAVDYLTRLGIYSVFPLLRKELIASDVVLGVVASSFPWTYGILSPIAGYLGDRFSRRTVILASIVGWSLAAGLCGLARNVWELVALRVLLAVAQVPFMPTAQALVADLHNNETRGKASGLFQSGSYAGIFLAGLPAAALATHFGWRMMLGFSGLLGLVLAVVMWRYLPAGRPGLAEPARAVSIREALSLLRVPSLLLITVAFALAGIAFWVLFTYLALFVYERYQVSLETAAFQATFYMQVSAMLLMPVLGGLFDRWTVRDRRNRFFACGVVSLLGIPALLAVGGGRHPALLITGLIAFGVVMAGTDASWMPMLCYVTQPRQRATAYGILNTCATLAGGTAAMVTAIVMKSVGLGAVILSLAGLFFLLAVLVVVAGLFFLGRDAVGVEHGTSPQAS
jgi:predicted MFS family arabinose efflux permease